MNFTKICRRCKGRPKKLSEFYPDKSHSSGYRRECKVCSKQLVKEWCNKHKSELKEYAKQYGKSESGKKAKWKAHLKYSYGTTEEKINNLLVKQKHKCAGCKKKEKQVGKLSIDHNHKTGKVRGLLCNDCNSGLGFLKDDIKILTNLIKYIRK